MSIHFSDADQPRLDLVQRSQILVHLFPVGLAQPLVERAGAFQHGVDQLDAALKLISPRFERSPVAAKQAVEHATRIVLGRDRLAFQAVGDGAGPREEPRSGVDRQHQRRLAAVLLGVQRDDLVEPHRVVRARLRVVQRGAGEPHVRTDVRVGLGTARMVQPAQEAQFVAKRAQRLGRLAEHELPVFLRSREPTPVVELVLRAGQRHAVGRVQGAEPSRNLLGDLFAHRLEHRQRQRDAGKPFEHGATVKLGWHSHERSPGKSEGGMRRARSVTFPGTTRFERQTESDPACGSRRASILPPLL